MKHSHSERTIQKSLDVFYGNFIYKLFNSYVFQHNWESDFFGVSRSGYSYEVEIKISRSDFKNDMKKPKHAIFYNVQKGNKMFFVKRYESEVPSGEYETVVKKVEQRNWRTREWETIEQKQSRQITYPCTNIGMIDASKILMPHKFLYAVPENLVKVDEIPEYAGLIYVTETSSYIVKNAPFIHKRTLDLKSVLLSKFHQECVSNRLHENYAFHADKLKRLNFHHSNEVKGQEIVKYPCEKCQKFSFHQAEISGKKIKLTCLECKENENEKNSIQNTQV